MPFISVAITDSPLLAELRVGRVFRGELSFLGERILF
jgi:hypothetical protein